MTGTEDDDGHDAAYLWSDKDGRAILDAERSRRERATSQSRPDTTARDPKERRCA